MFPVLLRLESRSCLIVGGGTVAARKAVGLLIARAQVTILSPVCGPDLLSLIAQGKVIHIAEAYSEARLLTLRPFLVFAATDDPIVNRQAAVQAEALGALVELADDAKASNFHSMAVVRRGSLILAAATQGASPALTHHARKRLESAFGPEYATLSDWLAALRPRLRVRITSQSERAAIWNRLIESDVLPYLRAGDEAAARALVSQITGETDFR